MSADFFIMLIFPGMSSWVQLNTHICFSPARHGTRSQKTAHTLSLCGEILNDTIMGVMRIYSSPSHLSFMNVSAGWEGAVLCCVCRPVKTRAWRAFAPERTSDHTTTDRIWPEKLRFNILHWKMVSAPFYISPLTYKTGHACSHILIIAPPNAGRCYCFLKGHVSESPAGCLRSCQVWRLQTKT